MTVTSEAIKGSDCMSSIKDFANSIKYIAATTEDIKKLAEVFPKRSVATKKMVVSACVIVNFLKYISEKTGNWIAPTQEAISNAFFGGTITVETIGAILSRLAELGIIAIQKNHNLDRVYLLKYIPNNGILAGNAIAFHRQPNLSSLQENKAIPVIDSNNSFKQLASSNTACPFTDWAAKMPNYHVQRMLLKTAQGWIENGFKAESEEQAAIKVKSWLKKHPEEAGAVINDYWKEIVDRYDYVLATATILNTKTSKETIASHRQFLESSENLPKEYDEYLESIGGSSHETQRRMVLEKWAKFEQFWTEVQESPEKAKEIKEKYCPVPKEKEYNSMEQIQEEVRVPAGHPSVDYSIPPELLAGENLGKLVNPKNELKDELDPIELIQQLSAKKEFAKIQKEWIQISRDICIYEWVKENKKELLSDAIFLKKCLNAGIGTHWKVKANEVVIIPKSHERKEEIENEYAVITPAS